MGRVDEGIAQQHVVRVAVCHHCLQVSVLVLALLFHSSVRVRDVIAEERVDDADQDVECQIDRKVDQQRPHILVWHIPGQRAVREQDRQDDDRDQVRDNVPTMVIKMNRHVLDYCGGGLAGVETVLGGAVDAGEEQLEEEHEHDHPEQQHVQGHVFAVGRRRLRE